jgi:trimethylamine--corrinoid protein Co-methyltransferase
MGWKSEGSDMYTRGNYTVNATPRFRLLSDDQIDELHQATLELMRRTGVQVEEPAAIEVFARAGCWIDGRRVRFPAHLVEWAIRASPSRVMLCDRLGRPAVALQGERAYFGTGSDTPNIVDPSTGERRLVKKDDVAATSRLLDALPHLSFMMCSGIASDVPAAVSDLHHFQVMAANTVKPIVFTAWSLENLKVIVEMAELVAGGAGELERSPFCALYTEPISPLKLGPEAVQKLMYMAEKGLPTVFTPGLLTGASGPVTIAGGLVQGNAEMLAGFVLAQLIREGTPLIYGGGVLPIDMRTTLMSYASPEFMMGACALKDMARRYRLPMFHFAGCSDAKTFDQQASLEGALWVMLAALNGGNLVHDMGYIDNGLTTSYQQLVVMDEVVGLVARFMEGIEVTEETMALEVIDQVGPGGQYLAEEHTLRHFRRNWFPTLLDRSNYSAWCENGKQSLGERAAARARQLLETHKPTPLPSKVSGRLADLVARAGQRSLPA